MSDALRTHVTGRGRLTPQGEPAREDQVKNNAGGFTFATSDENRLHRFLTIGTEGGTFHVGERELTRDNANGVVGKLAAAGDVRLIEQAVAVSTAGRAPDNDPALFALATAAGAQPGPHLSKDAAVAYRQQALDALLSTARTGTHILHFAAYAQLFRGWGPQLVKGVRNWYLSQEPDALAYQLFKYKGRDGWTQRDLIRLTMFKGAGPRVPAGHAALLNYVAKGWDSESLPELAHAVAGAHAVSSVKQWVRLIGTTRSLSWEMLPSEALREPEVWQALIAGGNLPPTALIRNLARLTTLGVLKQGDSFTGEVAGRLADADRLARARVHPVSVLLALKTYAQGHGVRGKGTWNPVPAVTDALDAGFYAAFGAVEPANCRVNVSLDVSGTMTHPAGGLPLSCRELVSAMAMIVMATEPRASIYAFGDTYRPMDISPRRRLDDVVRYTRELGMQRTDCALPMIEALRERREVDVFQVWTDSETWYGQNGHPHEALQRYREVMGIDARMQVVAVVPTEFSIADPLDPRQLDVSGFDAAVPNLLSAHARGEL